MSKGLNDLRVVLFKTIESVQSGTIDNENARQINDLAKTLIDTARVEMDYLRLGGAQESPFMTKESSTPASDALPTGITGITQHRLQG